MIQRIRRKTLISEAAIEKVLDALAEVIAEDITADKTTRIPGICSIRTSERGGYKRCDPGNAGQTIDIPIHRKVKFKPSIAFMRSVSALDPTRDYRG